MPVSQVGDANAQGLDFVIAETALDRQEILIV